jgi:hypothetical protein
MAAKTRQDLLDVLGRTTDPNWIQPILSDPDSAAPVNAAADALVLLSGQAQTACDNTAISTSSAGRGGSSIVTLMRTATGTHGTIPQGYTFIDSRGLLASSLGPTTVNNGDSTVQVAVQTQRKTELVNTITDPLYTITSNLAVADSGGTNALIGQTPAPAGYPTIFSTTFTVVASSTAISEGSSDWLSVIGRERGQLRQAGETDGAFRLRVRNVPDAVSPVAIEQEAAAAASHVSLPQPTFLEPFNDGADQSVRDNYGLGWFDCFYLSGLLDSAGNALSTSPKVDFMEDIQPDATNLKVRETVSLREARCYFRESLPGPIPDPTNGSLFWDYGFLDDYTLGYPDIHDSPALLSALMAVWEGCNRKRAAGVRFDVVIDELTRLTGEGNTTNLSATTVFTLTPPVGSLWWLRDGHYGWSRATIGNAGASLLFTFEDGSTYQTPTQLRPWALRVIGPLAGVNSTAGRITQIDGKLSSDGFTTATMVANLVLMTVVA